MLTGLELLSLGDMTNSTEKISDFMVKSIVEIKNIPQEMSKETFIKSLSLKNISELLIFITSINNLSAQDKKK
jgi:hypothetical protein